MASSTSGAATGSAGTGATSLDSLAAMIMNFQETQSQANANLELKFSATVDDIKSEFNKSLDNLDKKFSKTLDENNQAMNKKMEDLKDEFAKLKAAQAETEAKMDAMAADAAKPGSDGEGPEDSGMGFEASSDATMGKRKVQRTEWGPSRTPLNRGSSSGAAASSQPTGHYIGTPRGATQVPPPAAGPAASSGDALGYSPEKLHVWGFPRKLQQAFLRDHFTMVMGTLPQALAKEVKFDGKNMADRYCMIFPSAVQATESLAKFKTMDLNWEEKGKDREAKTHEIKFSVDRSIQSRISGKVVNSLWKGVEEWMKDKKIGDDTWSIHQARFQSVYLDIQGDAYEVFELKVNREGGVTHCEAHPDGLHKLGMTQADAQCIIDMAVAKAVKKQ